MRGRSETRRVSAFGAVGTETHRANLKKMGVGLAAFHGLAPVARAQSAPGGAYVSTAADGASRGTPLKNAPRKRGG